MIVNAHVAEFEEAPCKHTVGEAVILPYCNPISDVTISSAGSLLGAIIIISSLKAGLSIEVP